MPDLVFSMSDRDAAALSDIAQFLEIPRRDVVVKGLQLMALYAQARERDPGAQIVWREGGCDRVVDVLGEE